MKEAALAVAFAVVAMTATTTVSAQAPQTVRLRGTIEKIDGNALVAKSDKGDELKINLADKTQVIHTVKASMTDIKDGAFIGSGAVPQPDGSQKAIEVHIFSEALRGTAEGLHAWDGAPNGTMTNGTVGGAAVTGVNGLVVTVKYKDGEKNIVVGPDVPIVKFEIGSMSDVKPGVAFTVLAAAKQPDDSFNVSRINVGMNGVVPP